MNFFTVLEHYHHRRPGLHLLLVVKIFGVGLFRRRRLPAWDTAPTTSAIVSVAVIALGALHTLGSITAIADGELRMVVLGAVQGRPDELTVAEAFLFKWPRGW